jgi:serine phosphatase RsbU (regulator of sigma subunit)
MLYRVQGPDDPVVGARITLDRDTVVGRAVECDLCLPAVSVSRRHAVFRRTGAGWLLTDERSTTGTALNGKGLSPEEPAPLETGDRVAIGPWVFRVGEEATRTRTVAVSTREPTGGTGTSRPISSRRLDALSACLDAMERARTPAGLAEAVLVASMDGTGFGRAAVLTPGDPPVMVAGLLRTRLGVQTLEPGSFAPSRSLIEQARAGQTAAHGGRPGADTALPTHSIAEHAIHSAVCVPVRPEKRVTHLIYLDSRSGESPVRDAAGYCEDIARLYAFALTRDAQADLRRRQDSLRIELERARELRAMLAPAPTGRCGKYRHSSRTIAGMFVSADLFDAVAHPDGSATVLFGDASGHGVGAAMLAALVQAHLASALASGVPLGAAVAMTNHFVATRPTGGRFVSLVAATLDPGGRVSLVDAGHGHWLFAKEETEPRHAQRATSVPLGIDPDATFGPVAYTMTPGERLVCYTDGIPDQVNGSGEQFGFQRLDDALRASDGCDTDITRLFDALLRHADDRPLDDDATVASVQFDPG